MMMVVMMMIVMILMTMMMRRRRRMTFRRPHRLTGHRTPTTRTTSVDGDNDDC